MSAQPSKGHPLALLVIILVIATAIAGAIVMKQRADTRLSATNSEVKDEVVPVEVLTVLPVDIPHILQARGFLNGIEEITVRSEVTGRVVARPVSDGQHVGIGDVIYQIDKTDYELQAQRAKAELVRAKSQIGDLESGIQQAEAQLAAAEARLDFQQYNLERITGLRVKSSGSEAELRNARAAADAAKAEREAAIAAVARTKAQLSVGKSAVEVAKAAVNEAETMLKRCVIHSPIAGRINRVLLECGEYAVAGEPIAEIVRLDEMKMVVQVADTEVPLLTSFTHSEITADAYRGEKHIGKLNHVAPKMDSMSRKFAVELRVENEDESLLSGMYGQAVIACGWLRGVKVVPREAVFKHFGVDHCLVITNKDGEDCAELRQIEVGAIIGHLELFQVHSGLEDGDRVIVSRRRELRDGVTVTVGRTRSIDDLLTNSPHLVSSDRSGL